VFDDDTGHPLLDLQKPIVIEAPDPSTHIFRILKPSIGISGKGKYEGANESVVEEPVRIVIYGGMPCTI
jgi:hypothetical protein